MNKNKNNSDTEHVLQLAAKFEPKLVQVMSVEEYEAEWPRFTALVNTPVQGGSADALKQAMVDLADKLPSSASIVSTVHDELIVECTSDTAEEIKALVETSMLDAVQTMFPGVRFEVESGICDSWAEK